MTEFMGVPIWLILSGLGFVVLVMVVRGLFDDYDGTYD